MVVVFAMKMLLASMVAMAAEVEIKAVLRAHGHGELERAFWSVPKSLSAMLFASQLLYIQQHTSSSASVHARRTAGVAVMSTVLVQPEMQSGGCHTNLLSQGMLFLYRVSPPTHHYHLSDHHVPCNMCVQRCGEQQYCLGVDLCSCCTHADVTCRAL